MRISRTALAPRPVSTVEALKAIWGWLRGVKPTTRERQLESRIVERLAAETAVEDERKGKGGR